MLSRKTAAANLKARARTFAAAGPSIKQAVYVVVSRLRRIARPSRRVPDAILPYSYSIFEHVSCKVVLDMPSKSAGRTHGFCAPVSLKLHVFVNRCPVASTSRIAKSSSSRYSGWGGGIYGNGRASCRPGFSVPLQLVSEETLFIGSVRRYLSLLLLIAP